MIQVTAYKCGFCGCIMKAKGSMTRHEKFCSKNPANNFLCFYCKHLEFSKQPTFDGDGNFVSYIKSFGCEKLLIGLHTHKAVQRNMFRVLASTELMKLQCDSYSIGTHESRSGL